MGDCLLIDDADGVRVLTMNRPQARNAIDAETAFAMAAALVELDERDDLLVAVITGAGGSFCSGMDLKKFPTEGIPIVPGRGFAGITFQVTKKPLIAAVEGFALEGGFEIALACDLIVAASGAQFGLPEVRIGLVAAAGGLMRLPQRLPPNVAMSLILTGDLLDASTAFAHGLVSELCPDGEALNRAVALAKRIATYAPLAVAASKSVVVRSRTWPEDTAFAMQAELTDPVNASNDAHEGARAFTERRAPEWTGT